MSSAMAFRSLRRQIIPGKQSRAVTFVLTDSFLRLQGWLVIPGLDWHASEYVTAVDTSLLG